MKFRKLVEYFKQLEKTNSRLEIISILRWIFHNTHIDSLGKVIYLTTGKLAPDFAEIKLGVKNKFLMSVLSDMFNDYEIEKHLNGTKEPFCEDLGEYIEYKITDKPIKLKQKEIEDYLDGQKTVIDVHKQILAISTISGSGSQYEKSQFIKALLTDVSAIEAKYLVRIILGKLRFGAKEKSIIEALSQEFNVSKRLIENKYNICPDLEIIAKTVAQKGEQGLKELKIQIGRPIRMMAAKKMSTPEEILSEYHGECAVEYKYDGERVQVHISEASVHLFSRNHNDITAMFPDIVRELDSVLINGLQSKIIEGEIVAVDTNGNFLPFQILMQRKAKYGIEERAKQVPVKLFLFDILYADVNIMDKPFKERRQILENVYHSTIDNPCIELATHYIVSSPKELLARFKESIRYGAEGLMTKGLDKKYRAGKRDKAWIKFKFDYHEELKTTYDVVIVGYDYGRGKRGGTVGSVLVAVLNEDKQRLEVVCRVGTGLSDDELSYFKEMTFEIDSLDIVDSHIKPDVWVIPNIVIEITTADINLTDKAVCANGVIEKGKGLTIRFPRMERIRSDKVGNREVNLDNLTLTTTEEVVIDYKNQAKAEPNSRKTTEAW